MKVRILGTCIASLLLLAACGDHNPAAPYQLPDTHSQLTFESIPYDAVGPNKIVFNRFDGTASGLVTIDGTAKTISAVRAASTFAVVAAPGGARIAYQDFTAYNDKQRGVDIFVRDFNGMTGTALGGPGGERSIPAWTADGQRVVFAEDDSGQAGSYYPRIISQSPASVTDRLVLWQGSACEFAGAPSPNASGNLVFIYYPPQLPNCQLTPTIARKVGSGAPQIIYTPQTNGFFLGAPEWSPSGNDVAFFDPGMTTGFGALQLTIIAADGSNVRKIPLAGAVGRTSGTSLCWGRDGVHLFMTLGDNLAKTAIFSIRSDGTNLTQITTSPSAYDASVSCI